VLIWLWFTLHRTRLRDAGVGSGFAAGVALLYSLSVVLLVIVEASFAGAISGQTGDAKAASGLETDPPRIRYRAFAWLGAL
jgi:hypothetical protein